MHNIYSKYLCSIYTLDKYSMCLVGKCTTLQQTANGKWHFSIVVYLPNLVFLYMHPHTLFFYMNV